MLTQGPALNSKCKLIISTCLTLPHLLDCLIYTKNSMPTVLLLQMMLGWARWGTVWLIYISVWLGVQVVGITLKFVFLSCDLVFCCLAFSVPLLRWLEDDGCCVGCCSCKSFTNRLS